MIYKPTEKFALLDQSESYQGLDCETYLLLKRGEEVKIENPPPKLIKSGYIESVKTKRTAKEQ